MKGQSLTVLIKPVSSSCNMRCHYCFYNDVAQNRQQANLGVMSENTMKVIVDKAVSYVGVGGRVNFAFQGGEPTLYGREFFAKFIDYANDVASGKFCKTYFSLQTNGLLLDDKFCKFLAKEEFLVGLSLDGPQDMHDYNRLDIHGKGTFDRVMETVGRLRKHGVQFNVLCVVTAKNVMDPDKLYGFFQGNGFTHIQIIPCIEDFGITDGQEMVPEVAAYGTFLCRMFDLWLEGWEQGIPISIREFDNFAGMVMFGAEAELCSMRGICGVNVIAEADGSIYPCDFYVLDQWRLGNLCEAELENLLRGERGRRFIEMSRELADVCQDCQWVRWCHGGCRRMREPWSGGRPSTFKWCEAQKKFIPHAIYLMDRLSAAIQRATAQTGVRTV